jgi:hypothetical protein
MASTDVGSSYNQPSRVIPQSGKAGNDGWSSERKVACDILQEHEAGSKCANGIADVRPKVSVIVFAFSFSGLRERLARIASGEDVDRFDGRPVDACEVAEIANAGQALGEHGERVLVDLGDPRVLKRAEHGFGGKVEP